VSRQVPTPARRRGAPAGAVALWIALIGILVLWIAERPPGFGGLQYAGEVAGVLAVALLGASLVLATRLVTVERAFGGLDRVYVWHRWVATAGILMFFPHWLLVSSSRWHATSPAILGVKPNYGLGNNLGVIAILGLIAIALIAFLPRIPVIGPLVQVSWEKWLVSHRFAGVFVAAAVAHGLLVDPVMRRSVPLWWAYVAIGTVAVGAFAARQIGDLSGWGRADHVVSGVQRLNDTTVEVRLRPKGRRLDFVPGQFVYASFGGAEHWQRHPFTISNAPGDGDLRLSIKASGDHTNLFYRHLHEGLPASVEGPYGGFDRRAGARRQIWIAGGIGITPFLSWANALTDRDSVEVDLFYTVATPEQAVYLDELASAAARVPGLRVHLNVDSRDGFLSADRIARQSAHRPRWCSVFMCGPAGMIQAMERGLRIHGVAPDRIHYEEFSFR
jgi:predicted ferric reductase